MNLDFISRGFDLLFYVIIPLASVVAAIFFLRMWRRQARVADATLRWPSTLGRIEGAGVVEKDGSDGRMFRAELDYTYEVNGTSYTGHRITLHQVYCSDRKVSERAIERYPVGSEHPVYYDPAEPGSSLLKPGPTWWDKIPLVAGIGLLVCPFVWIIANRYFDERISRMRDAHKPEPEQPAVEKSRH